MNTSTTYLENQTVEFTEDDLRGAIELAESGDCHTVEFLEDDIEAALLMAAEAEEDDSPLTREFDCVTREFGHEDLLEAYEMATETDDSTETNHMTLIEDLVDEDPHTQMLTITAELAVDIDETLDTIQVLASSVAADEIKHSATSTALRRMADQFETLDDWLTGGGELPAEWRKHVNDDRQWNDATRTSAQRKADADHVLDITGDPSAAVREYSRGNDELERIATVINNW